MTKASLSRIFFIGGLLSIFFGFIHLTSGLSSEFTSVIIGDTVINTLNGLLWLVAVWLLAQGKQEVIWVVIVGLLASIVYAFAIGRGANIVSIVVGAFFLWQLYTLKKQGELY